MIETVKNELCDFFTKGTKNEVLIKKIAAVGLVMLFIYRIGYTFGVSMCHLGL